MQGTIEFRPEQQPMIHVFKDVTMKNIEKLWRSFKSDLKKAYYKPFTGSKRRWQCGDSRVDPDQWRVLVEHWEKDEIAVRIITQHSVYIICAMIKYVLFLLIKGAS